MKYESRDDDARNRGVNGRERERSGDLEKKKKRRRRKKKKKKKKRKRREAIVRVVCGATDPPPMIRALGQVNRGVAGASNSRRPNVQTNVAE